MGMGLIIMLFACLFIGHFGNLKKTFNNMRKDINNDSAENKRNGFFVNNDLNVITLIVHVHAKCLIYLLDTSKPPSGLSKNNIIYSLLCD